MAVRWCGIFALGEKSNFKKLTSPDVVHQCTLHNLLQGQKF